MKTGEPLLRFLDRIHCGGVLLDPAGSIMGINSCAEQILSKYRHVRRPSADAHNLNGWATSALKQLMGNAGRPPSLAWTVIKKTGKRPLIAHSIRLSARADAQAGKLLVLIDLNERVCPKAEVLQEVFGMTRTEAALAAGITVGQSVQDIAGARRISVETARAQLKTVLSKTQTHRQGELVALLTMLSFIT